MIVDHNSYTVYPGGEVRTKVTGRDNEIICLDYSMNGFMAVCQIAQVLRQEYKQKSLTLVYPYFPYARQDRKIDRGEAFSLKIFAQMLNSQNFDEVVIWDPHSDVVEALVNNCTIVPQHDIAYEVIPKKYLKNQDVLFISPDAGAYKKLSKLITDTSRICIGSKVRNAKGEITDTKVHSPDFVYGRTCVIVDDICDGGRTFVALAQVLKKQGALKVVLYVTHGIFSYGVKDLKQYIDEIYTTDSFTNRYAPYVTAERGFKCY